jgi:hypothetical protein
VNGPGPDAGERVAGGRIPDGPDADGRVPAGRVVDELVDDDEAGFVGGLWGFVFGLLLFVVGTLLVARAWAVVDTKFAVDAAARQAVRTYVEAPGADTAGTDAQEAADVALAGYGRLPSAARVDLVAGTFARCSRVTIDVSYPSPLVELPWLGSIGTAGRVSAAHSELVDPFRTGLPGTSTCA